MRSNTFCRYPGRRLLSLLLALLLVLGMTGTALAVEPNPDAESTYLLFLSDVHASLQEEWGYMYYGYGPALVDKIAAGEAGVPIDNVTFIGDTVAHHYHDEQDGMQNVILDTVLATWDTLDHTVAGSPAQDETQQYRNGAYEAQGEDGVLFVNGMTHESSEPTKKVKFTNAAGAYEYDQYIVYVIGCDAFTKDGQGDYADDAFDYQTAGAAVVAEELNAYLEGLADDESRPVFVCMHFPLYSAREGIPDGREIVRVLNSYADALDIVFLSGHNHSSDSDKEFFFPEGSVIDVPDGAAGAEAMTVQFPVMTAGYVNTNAISPNGNYTLCQITDDYIYLTKKTVGNEDGVKVPADTPESTGYLFTGAYTLQRNGVSGSYGLSWLDDQLHGTVSVNTASAAPGETITVTAVPDSGYVLSAVSYVSGGEAYPAAVSGNAASFTMPEGEVEAIRAYFRETGTANLFKEVSTFRKDGVYILVSEADDSGLGYALSTPRICRDKSNLGAAGVEIRLGTDKQDTDGSSLEHTRVIESADERLFWVYNSRLYSFINNSYAVYLDEDILNPGAMIYSVGSGITYDAASGRLSAGADGYSLGFDLASGYGAADEGTSIRLFELVSGPAAAKYPISYTVDQGLGAIHVSQSEAGAGAMVWVDTIPDSRYVLKSLTYEYGAAEPGEATLLGNRAWFYMPAAAVTGMTATFQEIGAQSLYAEVDSFANGGDGAYILVAADTEDGKTYALASGQLNSYNFAAMECWELTPEDGAQYGLTAGVDVAAVGYDALKWTYSGSSQSLENVMNASAYFYIGSYGLLAYDKTELTYDAETKTICAGADDEVQYVTCQNGVAGVSSEAADACEIRLFEIPAVREPVTYRKASALEENGEYVLVATSGEGKTFALSRDGYSVLPEEVTVTNNALTIKMDNLKWTYLTDTELGAENWLLSNAGAGYYLIMWPNGADNMTTALSLDYGADDYAIRFALVDDRLVGSYVDPANTEVFYLTVDEDGVFASTTDPAQACRVDAFLRSPDPIRYREATAFEAGNEYVVVTKTADNQYFALNHTTGDTPGTELVGMEGDTALAYSSSVSWMYTEDSFLANPANTEQLFYMGGGGFKCIANAAYRKTVNFRDGHITVPGSSTYYLSFQNGAFCLSKKAEEACEIHIYQKQPPHLMEVSAFREGKKYVLMAEDADDGKLYAIADPLTTESTAAFKTYEVSPDTIVDGAGFLDGLDRDLAGTSVYCTDDDTWLWTYTGAGNLQSVSSPAYILYPGSAGAVVYNGGNRAMTLVDGKLLGSGVNCLHLHSGVFTSIKTSVTPAEQGADFRVFELVEEEEIVVPPAPVFTITYDPNNDGGDATVVKTKYQDETYTLRYNPFQAAHQKLKEWNTLADGSGTGYAEGGAYKGNANLTLFAIWTKETFPVVYEANDGSGNSFVDDKVYEEDYIIHTPLERPGYRVVSWNTAADGSGENYQAGDTYTLDQPLTLKAQWKRVILPPLPEKEKADSKPETAETPAGSFDNFQSTTVYAPFTDTDAGAWYEKQGVLQTVVEMGLMSGDGDGSFRPGDSIRYSETVKLAAMVRSIYLGGGANFDQNAGEHWYDCYVDYLVEEKVMTAAFTDLTGNATRAVMAYLLASCLPEEALQPINDVTYADIPDVDGSGPYDAYILMLYRAGVLQGSDAQGTFHGEAEITRAEIAALVVRLTNPARRIQK